MGLDKNFNTAGANEMELADGGLTSATLSNCLKEGKPLADTGDLYPTIQDAVNAASSWVFVPPETFNESVTIDTAGLTLVGSGYNTLIDGGTTGAAINVNNSRVTVKNLSAQTTTGSNTSFQGVRIRGVLSKIKNVHVRKCDGAGLRTTGRQTLIKNCTVENTGGRGMALQGASRHIVSSCIVKNTGSSGILLFKKSNSIFSNNIIFNTGSHGLIVTGFRSDNNILVGNRVHNSTDNGIVIGSPNSIVCDNRVSDSGNSDIDKQKSSVILDKNLTGPSN